MNTSFERNEKNENWISPKWIFQSLKVWFDLDPCSCETQPWRYWTKEFNKSEDGLDKEWDGFIWCNPPYGNKAKLFIKKLSEHKDGGIALIFSRTDTSTWHKYIFPVADSVLFIEGRLKFCKPDGSEADTAGAASALIAYGDLANSVLEKSNIKGKLIKLR